MFERILAQKAVDMRARVRLFVAVSLIALAVSCTAGRVTI